MCIPRNAATIFHFLISALTNLFPCYSQIKMPVVHVTGLVSIDTTHRLFPVLSTSQGTNCSTLRCWFIGSKANTSRSYPMLPCFHFFSDTTHRSFAVLSTSQGANCSVLAGWFMGADTGGSGNCHWEYGHAKPFFLYANGNSAKTFICKQTKIFKSIIYVKDLSHGLFCSRYNNLL